MIGATPALREDLALALASVQRGLFNEPLPHLTAFATSLPCTRELLAFVETHGTIEDLAIEDDAIDPGALGQKLPLPSLALLVVVPVAIPLAFSAICGFPFRESPARVAGIAPR